MIAYVCNSPIQIMRAIYLKRAAFLSEEIGDLYIGAICPDKNKLISNIRKTNIFENVYEVSEKNLTRYDLMKYLYGISSKMRKIRRKRYDKLVSFNIEDYFVQALYNINYKTVGFEYHCVEDGPFLYQLYAPQRYGKYNFMNILGIKKQAFYAKKWWFSCPEYTVLPDGIDSEIEKLDPISPYDNDYLRLINTIFDYKPDKLLDQADLLIMEESHYTDGLMIDNYDFKLYKKLLDRYKGKKIIVKLHPRTDKDRFSPNGFKVLSNSKIPWELYVLNHIHNSTKPIALVSIVCGTMFSDKFMFGVEGKKLLLGPLFYDSIKESNGVCRVNKREIMKYKDIRNTYVNKDDFCIANTEKEIYETLDKWFK